MRRLLRLAAVGCVVTLAGTGCERTPEAPAQPPPVTLKLSGTTARDLQTALAAVPDIRYQVVSEGGSSITSLQDLRDGRTDVSMPMADVAYLAYSGQLKEMPGSFEGLRGMAVLTLNSLHLVAGGHTTIRTMLDLKGKRVSLGPPGSATALITEQLLGEHGIRPSEVHSERVPNPEFADRLLRREIDAAFVTYAPPNAGVANAIGAGARLVPIEGPAVERVRTRYPYLKRTLISRLTYPNQTESVHSVGVDAVLVCRSDVDENAVYRLLDAYFATRPSMRPPDLERAPATPIPLHPGAARYYRQRELSR